VQVDEALGVTALAPADERPRQPGDGVPFVAQLRRDGVHLVDVATLLSAATLGSRPGRPGSPARHPPDDPREPRR
jgi:hypothetical protein